jgi:hypothetical protein
MCICKKPLKELKMLIAFGTGFKFEMHFFVHCDVNVCFVSVFPFFFQAEKCVLNFTGWECALLKYFFVI